MPNIKSAKKRVKITSAKTMINKRKKTALKTVIKKYEAAVASGDKALATSLYNNTVKRVDQAVAHGLLHKNTAARKKSRFALSLNKM